MTYGLSPHDPKMAAAALKIIFSQGVFKVRNEGGGQGHEGELSLSTYLLLSRRQNLYPADFSS